MSKPWEKIIKFTNMSLNSDLDGADIEENECQKARDVIFDNGILEKAPGRSIVGTPVTGNPVDGICRSWDQDGNKSLLRVVNGVLERWTGSTWATVQSGLTPNVHYDFINTGDRTAIVNGYDEALDFDPSTNTVKKLGLEPPRFYKKVAYFETDEVALWSLGTGHAFNTTVFRVEERTGNSKQSLYLISPAATSRTSTLTYASAQNFSIYDNGLSVSSNDYFCISILHRTRDYVDSIVITFTTTTGNYYTLTIDGTELDPISLRDNVWTNILAKKSRFVATGSPSWASITKFEITLTGQTSNAEIYVDNCYFKNTPIEASIYRKTIQDFEDAASSWSITGGTVADDIDPEHRVEGTKSILVTRSGTTTTLSKVILNSDLSQFEDGILTQNSDDICLAVRVPASANLTSIEIRLVDGSGYYFYYIFTVASGEIATSAYSNWNMLRKAKSGFSTVGSPQWFALASSQIIITSTGALTLNFDQWVLEEGILTTSLANMETAETWAFAGGGSGGTSTTAGTFVEGEKSIYLSAASQGLITGTLTLAASVDLTQFAGSKASGVTDCITFWCYWYYIIYMDYIKLEIDCNTGDFATDYFYYEISALELSAISGIKQEVSWTGAWRVEIPKEDFTRVGATGAKGWDTVKAYRFSLKGKTFSTVLRVYFDDLTMTRRRGMNGFYQWACVFVAADGTKSGLSEWSEQISVTGTKAILTLLPLSADSTVIERRFYRKGGTLGSTARLDFTIYDNTTLTYFSANADSLLGEILDVNDIPQGTVRIPLGSKWGPKFKGEYILYRDPSNLRRVYYSLPDRIYGWSELQVYDFDSDVLDVFVLDNILFFNTKTDIRSLSIAMSSANPADFQERGLIKHSMGPFASCAVEEKRAMVSYDGVYLFNGFSFIYISDSVENYFDPSVYVISDAIVFYRKRHLYISVVTTGGLRSFLDCYIAPDGKIKWRTSDYTINCFCVAEGIGDNQEIYVGDTIGNVYQFDSGYAETFEFTTKDYPADAKDPFQEVVLSEIYIMMKSGSATPGGINIAFRMNQVVETTIRFPTSGDMTSVYKLYTATMKSIEDYLKGTKVGLTITPTATSKDCAIHAIKLIGEIAPLPMVYEE